MAMITREMIVIDEEKCDGCGLCVPSCAEGAIQIIEGKARLVSETYCDGLGACLADCPQGALTIEVRDADEFDPAAVEKHLEKLALQEMPRDAVAPLSPPAGGCPGSASRDFRDVAPSTETTGPDRPSELRQWPIQFHLVSPDAPYFQGADLLLAADCVPFAMADFHRDHLKGKGLIIACPKLDSRQEIYEQKLAALIDRAGIKSVTVMIMQVPCCGGLFHMVRQAVDACDRDLPLHVKVVGLQGELLAEETH